MTGKTKRDEVFWIVSEGNDPAIMANGEFGVEVNGVPYFYYKDAEAMPCDGLLCGVPETNVTAVKYRRVHKREFGEVIARGEPNRSLK